jgi:polysaccharide biosynthesis/export protein
MGEILISSYNLGSSIELRTSSRNMPQDAHRVLKAGAIMVKRTGLMAASLIAAISWQLAAAQSSAHIVSTSDKSSETAAPATSATTPQLQPRDSRYHLCAGDSFDVSFELSPEFNQTVTVQPDGFVTLKSVGDIKVQDQTIPQLTQTLREAYGKILNDPLIVVVLKDFQKPFFIADGQVTHPGKYEMRGNVTLAEAIAVAGGFTDAAKHSQVRLYRRVDDQWMFAKVFDLKSMEKKGDLHEDPLLHPGDMLYVPKNSLSKIKPFIPYTGVSAGAVLANP